MLRIACGIAVVGMLLSGCDDKRRHQTSEDVAFQVIPPSGGAEASPAEIARAALVAMHDLQTVRSQGLGIGDNRAKYEEAMGRLFGVADQDRIFTSMKPSGQGGASPFSPTDITKDAAVRKVAESWTSKTAYYIDGMDLDSLRTLNASDDRKMVVVPAVNAEEKEALAKIRADSGMGDSATPFRQLSTENQQKIRDAALAQGFNVPIEAEIKISLGKTKQGWRVQGVDVGPAR